MSALTLANLVRVLVGPPGLERPMYRLNRPARARSPYLLKLDRRLEGATTCPRKIISHGTFKLPVPEAPDHVLIQEGEMMRRPLVRKALKRHRKAQRRGRESQCARAALRLLAAIGREGGGVVMVDP